MTRGDGKGKTALVNIYLAEYAKVRFRRNVLFTFDDLLGELGITVTMFNIALSDEMLIAAQLVKHFYGK
jgi:hypothetical protein